MTWERDPLFAKAQLYFERAFGETHEDPMFGLLCSLGLELLARASLAHISPTLLAHPDPDQKNLLYALDRGREGMSPKSIGTARVFRLCQELIDGFSGEHVTSCLALANRRNDELHTGAAAFDEYRSNVWLPGFYRACNSLATSMGASLDTLLGTAEAKSAREILSETAKEVKGKVLAEINSHAEAFAAKSEPEQLSASAKAKNEVDKLVHLRHHRVTCPACKSDATVQGEPVGQPQVTNEDDLIKVRQPLTPRSFSCSACGLKLQGYAELDIAGLGGRYTRTSEFSPEEYFGLIDPNTADLTPYLDDYLADLASEYDNE